MNTISELKKDYAGGGEVGIIEETSDWSSWPFLDFSYFLDLSFLESFYFGSFYFLEALDGDFYFLSFYLSLPLDLEADFYDFS